jgi:hypothetical protein
VDSEIKEVPISEDDTVRIILSRIKAKCNFHLTDVNNKPFGMDDYPFGYVSTAAKPPLKLLHGSVPMGKKRDPTPRKDNRMAIEVRFNDVKAVYARNAQGSPMTYAQILSETAAAHSPTIPCRIERVRAEDDRISVEIVRGDDTHWFSEKPCPPLKISEDRLVAEAAGTGGWGSPPATPPMQTRAAVAKKKAVRVVDVFLHNLGTDDLEGIGRAADYGEAITLARNSGKVPNRWNIAVTEVNDERIVVGWKKGKIVAGDGVVSAVTAPKPEPKKVTVLPEKLVGKPKNADAAFAPREPVPDVPGILNAVLIPNTFKRCNPRPLDPAVGFWDIKVEILREQTRQLRVRKDVYGLELMAQAFMGIDLADDDRVKMVVKPLKKPGKPPLLSQVMFDLPQSFPLVSSPDGKLYFSLWDLQLTSNQPTTDTLLMSFQRFLCLMCIAVEDGLDYWKRISVSPSTPPPIRLLLRDVRGPEQYPVHRQLLAPG